MSQFLTNTLFFTNKQKYFNIQLIPTFIYLPSNDNNAMGDRKVIPDEISG